MKGKIIVISAPSGSGKSTIINSILDESEINLRFSVSATNRSPRPGEVDGVSYNFMTTEQFRDAIANKEFVEWEEVYPGRFYGTLRSQIVKATESGQNIILDIDVKGALNVKEQFGEQAMTIFIQAPSLEELRKRLEARRTDSPEVIEERMSKAAYELTFAPKMDHIVVNDELKKATTEVYKLIAEFIAK
jgi:guanylate kinase